MLKQRTVTRRMAWFVVALGLWNLFPFLTQDWSQWPGLRPILALVLAVFGVSLAGFGVYLLVRAPWRESSDQ